MTCPNLFGLFFRKSKFFKQKKFFMLQSTFSSVYFAIKREDERHEKTVENWTKLQIVQKTTIFSYQYIRTQGKSCKNCTFFSYQYNMWLLYNHTIYGLEEWAFSKLTRWAKPSKAELRNFYFEWIIEGLGWHGGLFSFFLLVCISLCPVFYRAFWQI